MTYREPSWKKAELGKATPEQIERWRTENVQIDNENRAASDGRRTAHAALLAAARDLYKGSFGSYRGEHPVIKAIKKHSFSTPAWSAVELFERALTAATEAIRKEAAIKDAARKAEQLVEDAIPYLAERGKKLGTDYKLSDAVRLANDIAFEEEVARRMAEGGPFEFSGDDYCENCSGWDGESRRCECGNRRVGWERDSLHSYKTPHVFAEAF